MISPGIPKGMSVVSDRSLKAMSLIFMIRTSLGSTGRPTQTPSPDSIRSTIRRQLLPDLEPTYAGYVVWAGGCFMAGRFFFPSIVCGALFHQTSQNAVRLEYGKTLAGHERCKRFDSPA